jgi:3-(3-hydroxy-phenyl)propionate hydroxylase
MILLLFLDSAPALTPALAGALGGLAREPVPIATRVVLTGAERAAPSRDGLALLTDGEGLAAARYAARPGTCYLFRPDQHVAARWRRFDPDRVRAAARRALAGEAAPVLALAEA